MARYQTDSNWNTELHMFSRALLLLHDIVAEFLHMILVGNNGLFTLAIRWTSELRVLDKQSTKNNSE